MKLSMPEPKWPKVYYNFEEERFELPSDGPDRYVYCPADEYATLAPVLSGKEYPLPTQIIELCEGLPVIDIGANVGTASVYFEEWLRPSEMYCFEPGERARSYLKRNAPNAEVWPQAVMGYGGTCTYYDNGATFMGTCAYAPRDGSCRVVAYDDQGQMTSSVATEVTSSEVRCIASKDVLGLVSGEIGVLKIDAESAEYDILRGARCELSKVRVIYLEYHNDFQRRKCDQVLDDFLVFHAKGEWLQGVVGYVNYKYAKRLLGD